MAVIHGFVSQLIKERKFLKNIHHREIWPPYITYLQTTSTNIYPWEGENDPCTHTHIHTTNTSHSDLIKTREWTLMGQRKQNTKET